MQEKNKRVIIVLSVVIIHLIIATNIRFLAREHNWHWIIQIILGSIPSFYSVVGLSSLVNIFEKKKKLRTPIIVGVASLLYEVTGDFGRTSGSGTYIDQFDIAAILLGIIIAYFIERSFSVKNEEGNAHFEV